MVVSYGPYQEFLAYKSRSRESRIVCGARMWQAAIEMPGDDQAVAFRHYVGKSVPRLIHGSLVVADGEESPETEKKSRDESRLGRLDSLRHES
jgi:hypothetical protein